MQIKKAKKITHPILIALSVIITSCTSPYRSPILYSPKDEEPKIIGVKELLKISGEVDIITIHGMCTHDGKWATGSINALAQQLGALPASNLKAIKLKNSQALIYKYQATINNTSKVNISAIVWSPILTPLKKELCFDQKEKTGLCATGEERPDFLANDLKSLPYKHSRATFNRLEKDTLMDDCLADAVIYQGKSHNEINRQMQEAIIAAAAPGSLTSDYKIKASERNTPLVIFTSSLGSKIGFDALNALSTHEGEDKNIAIQTIARTTNIFMAANQIPILSLADLEIPSNSKEPQAPSPIDSNDSLGKLLTLYQKNVQIFRENHYNSKLTHAFKSSTPTVIALSDPNDILSYSLLNYANRPSYITIDAIVSNDWTWLGLFENPASAHLDYLTQPKITDIIINGYEPDQ